MNKASLGMLFPACALVVLAGCATNIKTYVKPGQDFSRYKEIAIASFASDPKLPDTAKGAAELPAFLFAIMSEKGYAVLGPELSVAELKKLAPPPEEEFSPDTLAALGQALKVNAILCGAVKYYGVYEEATPAQLGPSTQPADSFSSSQRRLGFHSRDDGRVQPRFREQPAEVQKEYKATVRLELFDVASKSVVWWGETTVGGDQEHMKTYAKAVFDALLNKFPASPHQTK